MTEFRLSRRVIAPSVGLLLVAVIVALSAPLVTPGYDASFTLAWGRDTARGLPLDFAHVSSPTPHPLALLAGTIAGFAPLGWAINAAQALSVVAGLAVLALLCVVTFELTARRVAVGAALACAVVSAPIELLVLVASSDVAYCALGLGAVLLTLRGRYSGGVVIFMVAAMLRPEAVMLACVPLALSFMDRQAPEHRRESRRSGRLSTPAVFAAFLALAVAAWLAMGAAGGDLLVGLHSANTNAEINNDPRGPIVAFTAALPALATPIGWLSLTAATIALIATGLRSRSRPGTATRSRVRHPAAAVLKVQAQNRATTVIGTFIGIALLAYLAQGLLGTPLVARYLLLPALLCIALATLCIPLASRLVRSTRASAAIAMVVAVTLVVAVAGANVSGWQDVIHARQVRTEAFAAAFELLDTKLARQCAAPVVVRSPALVALTALMMDRPLREVTVSDRAGAGVLLQPLTQEAMELAGYGPMTSIGQQAVFPTDAPPRQSNGHWALYSSCQP